MAMYNAPYQYNSSIVNVNIDNQLAGILSNFDSDFILDLVDDHISKRLRVYQLPLPNVPAALENQFKVYTDGFSTNVADIAVVREQAYKSIIEKLCERFNLRFNDYSGTDYYSVAYWMYEFLVSNFTSGMINFFISYLISEKDGLYLNLDLENRKDNQYAKKIFEDQKIAAIHANLDYVLEQISVFDISLWDILTRVYATDPKVADYLYNIISDEGNFFKDQYMGFIQSNISEIIIQIRLGLQSVLGSVQSIQ